MQGWILQPKSSLAGLSCCAQALSTPCRQSKRKGESTFNVVNEININPFPPFAHPHAICQYDLECTILFFLLENRSRDPFKQIVALLRDEEFLFSY